MDAKEKHLWIMENRCKAEDAVGLLISAKKQRVSEYDERLRKLRDLQEELRIKSIDPQAELFSIDEIISPELLQLMRDPTHKLGDDLAKEVEALKNQVKILQSHIKRLGGSVSA